MATEETIWQSTTGQWNAVPSWTNGIPSIGAEPTVARLGPLSKVDVRSGLTGASCQRLITTPEYTGAVGASGAPLEIEIGDLAVLRGRGKHTIEFDSGGFSNVVVDSSNLADAALLTGVIGRFCCKAGKVVLGSGATLTYQVIVNGELANVVINASTAAMAPVVGIDAGVLENYRSSPSGNYKFFAAGGKVIQRGPLLTGDVIFTGPGCVFRYLPSSAPATNPEIILLSGYSDFQASGFLIGVDKNVIGQNAEVAGSPLESGGYPPGSLSEPIDLREDYP